MSGTDRSALLERLAQLFDAFECTCMTTSQLHMLTVVMEAITRTPARPADRDMWLRECTDACRSLEPSTLDTDALIVAAHILRSVRGSTAPHRPVLTLV
ncbi:hypothetical protein [Gordonia sp. NPDC003422]